MGSAGGVAISCSLAEVRNTGGWGRAPSPEFFIQFFKYLHSAIKILPNTNSHVFDEPDISMLAW